MLLDVKAKLIAVAERGSVTANSQLNCLEIAEKLEA
jgi:hypothetical protein